MLQFVTFLLNIAIKYKDLYNEKVGAFALTHVPNSFSRPCADALRLTQSTKQTSFPPPYDSQRSLDTVICSVINGDNQNHLPDSPMQSPQL